MNRITRNSIASNLDSTSKRSETYIIFFLHIKYSHYFSQNSQNLYKNKVQLIHAVLVNNLVQ